MKTEKKEEDKRKTLSEVARILDAEQLDLQALSEHIDVQEFLNFWALESLIGFWDGYCSNQNNFFVYLNPNDSKLHFIPWGADVAFSRSVLGVMFKRGSPQCVNLRARLPHAMYNHPEMQSRYFKTLDGLLDDFWNEDDLIAETKQVESLLIEHLGESQQDFAQELKATREFINGRREELAKERIDGPPKWDGDVGIPFSATRVGSASGTMSVVWLDKKPEEPSGEVTLEVKLEERGIAFTELEAYVTADTAEEDGQWSAPELVITGLTDGDEKASLTLTINEGFADISQPIRCHGKLIEGIGGGFFNPPTERVASGTITLSKVSRENGEPVIGKFNVRLYEYKIGN